MLEYSEGTNGPLRELGEEGAVSGGVFDHSTSEEDGLVTWEALAFPRRKRRCRGEPVTRLRRTARLRAHVSSAHRGTEEALATREATARGTGVVADEGSNCLVCQGLLSIFYTFFPDLVARFCDA